MHPILDRLAGAYRPLAARNRLVEGAPARPVARRPRAPRLILLALVAARLERRP